MVQAYKISKSFGEQKGVTTRVLKDVSLEVTEGEMVSIMGPSGCGKTTLLHVLSGIENIDDGEIFIGGNALHTMGEKKLAQFRLENMGFVFQSYHLIPVLSILENVELPLIARGVKRREAKQRALQALKQVGLAEKADHVPSELSGGQNQRVAIARAIVGEPKVIWADEPTGALDSQTAEQIIGLLGWLNETYRTTIVIVTHDPQVAAQTDRIIRMENGRVLSYGEARHA